MGLDLLHPHQSVMLQSLSPLLFGLQLASGQHGHHGVAHHAPELLCRDTNTSVYAEVCVPAFAEQVTPVTLAVKEVVDNDYCFDRVLTICEETNTVVQREICTYVYEREDVVTDCQTTQVTYDEKSETMKVTACGVQAPAYGYAADPYHGEHQVCHEEYQTQAYKVPLVTAPLTSSAALPTLPPRRSASPRTSPSLRSSARTRLRTSASTLPSSSMPPTPLTRRRSSSGSPAASRSPSPSTLRPAGSSTTRLLPTPSLLSTTPLTMLSTTLPPSTTLSTMDRSLPQQNLVKRLLFILFIERNTNWAFFCK